MDNQYKEVRFQFRKVLDTLFANASSKSNGLSDNAKQKVFISFCFGEKRARTVNGIGNSLKTAFESARNSATKVLVERNKKNGKDELPKWIMIDIVAEEVRVPIENYYTVLKETRRGYLRYGVSFDEMYNIAFLEQEIYGNNLIKYINPENQYFDQLNITNYLKLYKHFRPQFVFNIAECRNVTLFETKSYFYDEGQFIDVESSPKSYQKGIRDIFNGKDERSQTILDVIHKTGDSLLSTLKSDGSFVYGYFPCFNAVVPGYNVLRHVLAAYSLFDLFLLNREERYREGAEIALNYVINECLYYHDNETAFVVDKINETDYEIKLGALGMTILAITRCMEIGGDNERYLSIIRKLGNGILYMQDKSTGNFTHVLNYPDMEVKDEFRIIYYAGEAVFALLRLYTADKNQKWMDSIEKSLEFFIENDYHKYGDHWLAYAINELTLYKTDDKYFEFALKNVFHDIDFVIERDTTWNTFLEMLNVSIMVVDRIKSLGKHHLLEGYDIDKLYFAMETRFEMQLSSIMFPEIAMFFKCPEIILYGIFIRHHTFRIRNDDIAHHLMGYCNYYRNKFGIPNR